MTLSNLKNQSGYLSKHPGEVHLMKYYPVRLMEKDIYFLPRHNRLHNISPSNINYLANIYALKSLGVTDIISVSAVGSLKERLTPGKFVIVDQFIDRTYLRKNFF